MTCICLFLFYLIPAQLTKISGRFEVNVVEAAAYADDDPQGFELLQVLPHQCDGVVHQSSHSLVQNLATKTQVTQLSPKT